MKFAGNNPTFDIEILNSRDDPDVFGDPDVSRVIIGGTQAQLGITTIGIAQSVDPGNFDLSEDSVVLLDRLSAPAGPSISLNSYAIDPGSSKIDFIGVGVAIDAVDQLLSGAFREQLAPPYEQFSTIRPAQSRRNGVVSVHRHISNSLSGIADR